MKDYSDDSISYFSYSGYMDYGVAHCYVVYDTEHSFLSNKFIRRFQHAFIDCLYSYGGLRHRIVLITPSVYETTMNKCVDTSKLMLFIIVFDAAILSR
jgi:hypothetical protein